MAPTPIHPKEFSLNAKPQSLLRLSSLYSRLTFQLNLKLSVSPPQAIVEVEKPESEQVHHSWV